MHHNDVGIDISRWPVGRAGKGVQKLALTHTHTHTHALVILVQVDEVDTHVDARLKDPVNQYPAILGERHPVFRRDDYASFNLVPRSCCLVMVLCVCVGARQWDHVPSRDGATVAVNERKCRDGSFMSDDDSFVTASSPTSDKFSVENWING